MDANAAWFSVRVDRDGAVEVHPHDMTEAHRAFVRVNLQAIAGVLELHFAPRPPAETEAA
jgi:hypothetical protein